MWHGHAANVRLSLRQHQLLPSRKASLAQYILSESWSILWSTPWFYLSEPGISCLSSRCIPPFTNSGNPWLPHSLTLICTCTWNPKQPKINGRFPIQVVVKNIHIKNECSRYVHYFVILGIPNGSVQHKSISDFHIRLLSMPDQGLMAEGLEKIGVTGRHVLSLLNSHYVHTCIGISKMYTVFTICQSNMPSGFRTRAGTKTYCVTQMIASVHCDGSIEIWNVPPQHNFGRIFFLWDTCQSDAIVQYSTRLFFPVLEYFGILQTVLFFFFSFSCGVFWKSLEWFRSFWSVCFLKLFRDMSAMI